MGSRQRSRPYLLQRRQGDVQVAHGSLRETLGVLALLEEGEPTAGLLAIVSHLQHNTADACLVLHFLRILWRPPLM